MINHKFDLDKSFQQILYRIDNWINEGSGWIVELIESQYINISTYRPLSGSSYIKLPAKLRSPKKGLIKIKNNDEKCFLWCHVRHSNLIKIHPERIAQKDEELDNELDYDGSEFSLKDKNISKLDKKNNICINVFCYENKPNFPIYISDQKFENSMELLLIADEKVTLRVYQVFKQIRVSQNKIKTKNTFAKVVYNVLVVKMY